MGIRGVIVSLAVAGATAAAVGYAQTQRFVLREYRIGPAEADRTRDASSTRPLRILHLSDLHSAPWQRRKIQWVRGLAANKPDLVVTTGDLLGHQDAITTVAEMLEPLRGIPGVFVHGSNDYYGPEIKNPVKYLFGTTAEASHDEGMRLNTGDLERVLEDLGWVNLNNRAVQLTTGGRTVELWGTDDAHKGFDDLATTRLELAELRSSSKNDPVLRIGVTHAPYRRVLDSFVRDGSDLILAGHTHGGQICLPAIGSFNGTLVTNCDIPAKQAKGLSLWRAGTARSFLHVSAGLGTSIYAPVRLFCPPEASLLSIDV